MVESSRNERLTAFVSTIVAVAILAAGVTATQQQEFPGDDATQAVADLRFQLDMAFRHDARERDTRIAQLDSLVSAWEKSPKSADDQAMLFQWLQESAGRSLPGALAPLPALPVFSSPAPPIVHEVKKVPVDEKPIVIAPSQPVGSQPSLVKKSVVQTPITPTPNDPLEEEMVALRQPESLAPDTTIPQPKNSSVAPRPAIQEEPKLVPQQLLASVPINKEPVGVNLTELAARIAGYHDSLDEVETALLRMNSPSLDVVIEQINSLDRMTRDYGFVTLYYDSLSTKERQQVIEPRSMKSTLVEVDRQLDRCAEILDGDFLGSFDQAAVQEIAGLRAKIKAIGERVASSER